MKTKIILTALLSTLLLNVNAEQATGLSGEIEAGYKSQHHRRGEIVSQDAVQTGASVTSSVNGVGVTGKLFTSQSIDSGSDSLEASGGFNLSLNDKLSLYAGLYNTDNDVTGSTLEGLLALNVDTLLSPTLTVYRDVSDELYTVDARVTDQFTTAGLDISLDALIGWTENTEQTDTTYYEAGVGVQKQIKQNVSIGADVSWSDSDTRDDEWIYATALTIKF